MDILHSITLFLHFVGAAALLGGWLATYRSPTVVAWQHIGAWIQLVTGVLLVGLLEMGDADVNHMKIAVKLVLLIAILVAAILGRRRLAKGGEVSTGMAHAVGGLTLVNIAIAVFW